MKSRAEGRSQFLAWEPLPRLETPWAWAARAVPSSSSSALGGRQALYSAWKVASSALRLAWSWSAGGPSRAWSTAAPSPRASRWATTSSPYRAQGLRAPMVCRPESIRGALGADCSTTGTWEGLGRVGLGGGAAWVAGEGGKPGTAAGVSGAGRARRGGELDNSSQFLGQEVFCPVRQSWVVGWWVVRGGMEEGETPRGNLTGSQSHCGGLFRDELTQAQTPFTRSAGARTQRTLGERTDQVPALLVFPQEACWQGRRTSSHHHKLPEGNAPGDGGEFWGSITWETPLRSGISAGGRRGQARWERARVVRETEACWGGAELGVRTQGLEDKWLRGPMEGLVQASRMERWRPGLWSGRGQVGQGGEARTGVGDARSSLDG